MGRGWFVRGDLELFVEARRGIRGGCEMNVREEILKEKVCMKQTDKW